MKKETIICIIVVALIVIINTIETRNTKNSFEELVTELDEVRSTLVSENENENLKEKIDKIIKDWKDKNEKIAYYIEHNELEKLEMYLWELNSYVETGEKNMAIQVLDTCKYMTAHIEEKYKFSLKNIF